MEILPYTTWNLIMCVLTWECLILWGELMSGILNLGDSARTGVCVRSRSDLTRIVYV